MLRGRPRLAAKRKMRSPPSQKTQRRRRARGVLRCEFPNCFYDEAKKSCEPPNALEMYKLHHQGMTDGFQNEKVSNRSELACRRARQFLLDRPRRLADLDARQGGLCHAFDKERGRFPGHAGIKKEGEDEIKFLSVDTRKIRAAIIQK